MLKRLEQIDYPISAPQKEDTTSEEYIKEKKKAIKEMVDKLSPSQSHEEK